MVEKRPTLVHQPKRSTTSLHVSGALQARLEAIKKRLGYIENPDNVISPEFRRQQKKDREQNWFQFTFNLGAQLGNHGLTTG